jgi:hypothetical protein
VNSYVGMGICSRICGFVRKGKRPCPTHHEGMRGSGSTAPHILNAEDAGAFYSCPTAQPPVPVVLEAGCTPEMWTRVNRLLLP